MLARQLGRSARTAAFTRKTPLPHRHFSTSRTARSPPSSSARREFNSFIFDAHAACKGKRCHTMDSVARPEGCGEDSFFVSPTIVGVADGVGGWNENGVDPSAISRALMRYARQIVFAHDDPANLPTLQILDQAYAMTLKDDAVEAGSTTACIIKIREDQDGNPLLDYTNLGDSGFAIIRGEEVVFRSAFQSIGLAPFQLAKIPERFRCYGAMESKPEEANNGTIPLQDGDIIVLATDGVWDNFAADLSEIPAFFPPVLSWRRYWHGRIASLVSVVQQKSVREAAEGVVHASLEHNLKPDDITVIVAKVTCKPKAKL